MKLRDFLSKKLSNKQMSELITAFDMIGDIAVIEIPSSLVGKEKIIGETLLKLNKNIKVVCKKVGIHKGIFRLQKYKNIAGERRKETEYKESGVRLKLNIEKVYFSPRMSTERLRIAKLCKKGEEVLVMFSGIAPYPCVIAKNSDVREVYGIEINSEAHDYAIQNVALNKLGNVKLFLGDVKMVIPTFSKKFDRVVMPLPKGGEDFLNEALSVVKKNGYIHFYDFLHIDDFDLAKKKVKDACLRMKKKCRIVKLVKCGHFGPRIYRICVDMKIL